MANAVLGVTSPYADIEFDTGANKGPATRTGARSTPSLSQDTTTLATTAKLRARVQRRIAFASALLPLVGPLLLLIVSFRRMPRMARAAFQALCFQLTMVAAIVGVWFVPSAGPLAAGGLLELMMLLSLRAVWTASQPQRHPYPLAWRWRG